ncbi:MAG: bifunctional metallophosphatase/5'-nucleotidase [bacterium]|nr:bifunctional metallophosphatase/5'-nucleotidase [bacterium]
MAANRRGGPGGGPTRRSAPERHLRAGWLPGVLGAVLLAVTAPVTAADVPAPAPGAGPWNLTLFHTNDTHAGMFARPADWRDDGRPVGGIVALAHHLAEQRRSAPADLLVDAGDFMTGNPVCNLREDDVPGAAIARLFNALDYDAGLVGNHEFDIGLADLQRLLPRFGHPVLAADIVDDQGRAVFRAEPVVLERGGVRIGIMGVSCSEMTEVVAPSRFPGLRMAPQAPLLRRQAAELDPATDLLIVLTHNGLDKDRELAAALAGAGIDVIVGGHSHTRMRQPELVEGILIVQAGSALTNLGRLDLRVEDDRVAGYDGRLVSLWADSLDASGELDGIAALTYGYEDQVRDQYGRVLGTLATDLRRGRGESALGNWLADVLREAAGADVGVINSGGIRRDLPAGPLTALHIHEVLPFANSLVTVRMSGRELATVADWNAAAQVSGDHGILQVSGLEYLIVAGQDGAPSRAGEVTVGGRPLDPEAAYLVAMPDFVAMMAPVYLGCPNPRFADTGRELSGLAAEAIQRVGTVRAPAGGRIRGAPSR